jgi:hypothetical protein
MSDASERASLILSDFVAQKSIEGTKKHDSPSMAAIEIHFCECAADYFTDLQSIFRVLRLSTTSQFARVG